MGSKKEVDAKEMLALFQEFYFAGSKLHEKLVELSRESVQKGQENKRATMSAFLGELKQINAGLHELHHSIGHLMFGDCWDRVKVGDEFKNPVQELLDALGIKFVGMELLDLSQPIPDHLPEEVKEELRNLKQARTMSAKAHLH